MKIPVFPLCGSLVPDIWVSFDTQKVAVSLGRQAVGDKSSFDLSSSPLPLLKRSCRNSCHGLVSFQRLKNQIQIMQMLIGKVNSRSATDHKKYLRCFKELNPFFSSWKTHCFEYLLNTSSVFSFRGGSFSVCKMQYLNCGSEITCILMSPCWSSREFLFLQLLWA